MGLYYLAHILGFTLWLGGGFASTVLGIRSRKEDRSALEVLLRLQRAFQANLMLPGILLTLFSGIYLSLPAARAAQPSSWLMVMQGCGLLAALLYFFVGRPTSARMMRISAFGETAPLFDALRNRAATVGMITGMLGLLALIGGVLHKYGV